MSTTVTKGEFKARLSEVLALVWKGRSVTVTYGRVRHPVAVFGPPPMAPCRKQGYLACKVRVSFARDGKVIDEE
jgi:hypothetical protein